MQLQICLSSSINLLLLWLGVIMYFFLTLIAYFYALMYFCKGFAKLACTRIQYTKKKTTVCSQHNDVWVFYCK